VICKKGKITRKRGINNRKGKEEEKRKSRKKRRRKRRKKEKKQKKIARAGFEPATFE
jgi:hypothetical protein